MIQTVHGVSVTRIGGGLLDLSQLRGKVLCIANIAGQCTFAHAKMQQLCELDERLRRSGRFEVLAFPCNQFANQEPRPAFEVAVWAKDIYGAQFEVFESLHVRGARKHPLYQRLTQRCGEAQWNFTTYLCDPNGVPVRRYLATESSVAVIAGDAERFF